MQNQHISFLFSLGFCLIFIMWKQGRKCQLIVSIALSTLKKCMIPFSLICNWWKKKIKISSKTLSKLPLQFRRASLAARLPQIFIPEENSGSFIHFSDSFPYKTYINGIPVEVDEEVQHDTVQWTKGFFPNEQAWLRLGWFTARKSQDCRFDWKV